MSSSGRTVLIADDDPEIRGLIAEYLRSNAYEVLEAENGLETLLLVKRSKPNVVILDDLRGVIGHANEKNGLRRRAAVQDIVQASCLEDTRRIRPGNHRVARQRYRDLNT